MAINFPQRIDFYIDGRRVHTQLVTFVYQFDGTAINADEIQFFLPKKMKNSCMAQVFGTWFEIEVHGPQAKGTRILVSEGGIRIRHGKNNVQDPSLIDR